MHIQTDRALIPARTTSVRYLHVVVSAPPVPAATAPPRSPAEVALVLDRSGSMGGTKIAMARKAVDHAVRLLGPQDVLAVVCYDERVETVLARTLASQEAKRLALRRLAQIDARGSTDLSGGWLKGADEVRGSASADGTTTGVKRVLLLTDGLANRGVIDGQALAATAARLRADGITTSTFGIGADFDEELLSRLASQGGGHFYFIEQAGQIPDFFASELGEALVVVARDVVFEVTCSAGARVALLNDLPKEEKPGRLRVRLGDLTADQEITLLVAVQVHEPPALGNGVEVLCRLSDRDHVLVARPLPVDWAVVSAADNDAQPVNHAVVLAVATLVAEGARGQALAANRRGDFKDAQHILLEAVHVLGEMASGDPDVERLRAELRHNQAEFSEAMDAVQTKRRHFAMYSVNESREPDGKARRRAKAS